MELKMNAIRDGQTTKARVVNETIEQYRGVYARMQQHPDVLRTVRTESWRTYFFADVIVGCSEVCFR
jgi:DNA topoisomerase-3